MDMYLQQNSLSHTVCGKPPGEDHISPFPVYLTGCSYLSCTKGFGIILLSLLMFAGLIGLMAMWLFGPR